MEREHKTLILGVGNLILGDEGVGPQAIPLLEARGMGQRANLMDGGTGGFHLLGEIEGYQHLILIDATLDQHPAGTLRVIRPKFASDYPPSLSAHDIGLKDLLETAQIMGFKPDTHLVVMSVASIQPMSLELSPPVAAAMPALLELVEEILTQIEAGAAATR